MKEYSKKYARSSKRRNYVKEYFQRAEIKERMRETSKRWREQPGKKEHIAQLVKKNRRIPENLEKKRSRGRNYIRQKGAIDNMFRVNRSVSGRIYYSIKEEKAGRHWELLVGYTLQQLKEHLEALFQPGMSWDSYGQWHIDHIIPISVWEFEKPEDREFKQCWALANLQPLWAKDNLRKHSRVEA